MKNPPENPQGYDWRLRGPIYVAEDQVIAGTGGQVARKGARIIFLSQIKLAKHKVLTIPVPNASALLLGAAAKAYCAAESLRADNSIDGSLRKEVSFHNDSSAFDYLQEMIQSIVLAFTAIEAFANETIPSDYIYGRHHRSEIILQAVGKTEIERRITIDEKLCEVLPDVLKCKSPKGSSCWQAYKKLRETRDRIIHFI